MLNAMLPMLMPYLINLILAYIKSSNTESDDKILKVVQEGCKYLAEKDNNTVQTFDAVQLSKRSMNDQLTYSPSEF